MSDSKAQNDRQAPVSVLSSLVSYQNDAIVSKQLLKKESGNITLFAFSKGEGLSEHTAPFDAWILLLEGEAEISIGEETYAVSEGETITLPANIPHAVQSVSDFKMLLVMLK